MAKRKRSRCRHDWVKKWEGQFRRCTKCRRAEWWWVCKSKWQRRVPAAYLYVGHQLAKDTALRAEAAVYSGRIDAHHYDETKTFRNASLYREYQNDCAYYKRLDEFNNRGKNGNPAFT